MRGAIDVGTNTVRLLLGDIEEGRVVPRSYHRTICRLGGGFHPERGLAPEAMERTLSVLTEMAERVRTEGAAPLRAVGTEALRRAVNGPAFVERVRRETGLPLEIIGGEEEARLSARGVTSALDPVPERALIFDIGGGSTEFVLWERGIPLFHRSYPLGTVQLAEALPAEGEQAIYIEAVLDRLEKDLGPHLSSLRGGDGALLVGTAGTVTTLAALDLEMTEYDWRRVNNHPLSRRRLEDLRRRLTPLDIAGREALAGMEKGRGDLILPGLRTVLAILARFRRQGLTVSDFGLLEGILLAEDTDLQAPVRIDN